MKKGLLLYILVFSMLLISYSITFLEPLAPLGLLILLLGVLILWRFDQQKLTDLGFRRHKYLVRWIGLGLILGLILPLFYTVLQVGFGWIVLEPRDASVTLFAMGIIRITLIVLMEEVVFRGFFIQKLAVPEQPWVAIVASSVLWAFLHIPNMIHSGLSIVPIIIGMGSFVILGIALGLGFLNTESNLWLPLGIHLGYNNAFSTIGTFFQGTISAPSLLVGEPPWTPESGLVGILLATTILVVVFLLRFVYSNSQEE